MAECYALGLDPTDATNDFRIVSDEPLDGGRDTGRAEGGGVAGGAVGGGAGRWRLAGDGSPHHAVLQGGGGVAVAARAGRAPYQSRQDGGCPSQGRTQ